MAKTAKPTLTVEDLRRANVTLDELLSVRQQIAVLEGCVAGRRQVPVSIQGLTTDYYEMQLTLRSEVLFEDLDTAEQRLAATLRSLGVDVPPREAVAAPAKEVSHAG